ncbi:MAG: hypothetical protein MHM6MM_003209 [Cercozoa sp. M6MM]
MSFDQFVSSLATPRQPILPSSRDSPWLQSLTDKQYRAATLTTEREPVAILAAAGAGKTSTLCARITNLVRTRQASPEEILAITFTRKAAGEMAERLHQTLGHEAMCVTTCTFHSLCLRILRQNIKSLEFSTQFFVLGPDDQKSLVGEVLLMLEHTLDKLDCEKAMQAGLPEALRGTRHTVEQDDALMLAALQQEDYTVPRRYRPGNADMLTDKEKKKQINFFTNFVRRAKSCGVQPHELYDSKSGVGSVYAFVLRRYQDLLKKRNSIDFGDMIPKTVRLLRAFPHVLEGLRVQIRHVVVDEFQDVSQQQIELVMLLACGSRNNNNSSSNSNMSRSLCVCGDDDQCIYAFRGACDNAFIHLEESSRQFDLEVQTIKLDETFRTTQVIADAAQSLIQHNKRRVPKQLRLTRLRQAQVQRLFNESPPPLPRVFCSACPRTAAKTVCSTIKQLRELHTYRWQDFAILGRTGKSLKPYYAILRKEGIPTKLPKRQQSKRRKVMLTDAGRYLCALAGACFKSNIDDFARVCRAKGVTQSTVQKLRDAHAKRVQSTASAAAGADVFLAGALNDCAVVTDNKADHSVEQTVRLANLFLHSVTRKQLVLLQDVCSLLHRKRRAVATRSFRTVADVLRHLHDQETVGTEGAETVFGVAEQFEIGADVTTSVLKFVCAAQEGEITDAVTEEEADGTVSLTTIHQAKGREWKVVFVVACVDGVMPLPYRPAVVRRTRTRTDGLKQGRSGDKQQQQQQQAVDPRTLTPEQRRQLIATAREKAKNRRKQKRENTHSDVAKNSNVDDRTRFLEEERRLAYVAMTRARERLYMCAYLSDDWGEEAQLSAFVQQIDAALLDFGGTPTRNESENKKRRVQQESAQTVQKSAMTVPSRDGGFLSFS